MSGVMEFEGRQIPVDNSGYLLNPADWSQELAEHIAEKEQIAMTDPHWEVVHFVRKFYLEFNTSPAIRALVKAMEKTYGPEKGNSRYLQRLFPEGPAKQASKIAGLPKPAKCL
ncbi:TusE/DsrC/DsvC family sulfur relay protein [Bowmanella dokdonensis]|uniref:Sulfurtransferase n=1 Tax=Bowmanella dokdonensis TaxID=751969 RepID=A0A939DMC6_9ALTE|nr:TusE/DsrC/DsvC family sulfur relay protein [Bowmanella dokdonensis]MBN7824466.1 TusE/DsrC/DsvC family sulfur relay protein [Bowmanella dokdonensis]